MKKIVLTLTTLLVTLSQTFAYRYIICIGPGSPRECIAIEANHSDLCRFMSKGISCSRENRISADNSTSENSSENNAKKMTYKVNSKTGGTIFYSGKVELFEIPKTSMEVSKELVKQISSAKSASK